MLYVEHRNRASNSNVYHSIEGENGANLEWVRDSAVDNCDRDHLIARLRASLEDPRCGLRAAHQVTMRTLFVIYNGCLDKSYRSSGRIAQVRATSHNFRCLYPTV